MPVKWHMRLAQDHPFGVSLKAFYDAFLAPLGPIKAQPYTKDVFTWWRHACCHMHSIGQCWCPGLLGIASINHPVATS